MRGTIVSTVVGVAVFVGLIALARRRSERSWTTERYEKERRGGTALRTGRFPLDGLITHVVDPRDPMKGYELANPIRDQTMGICFDWSDANA